MIWTWRFWLAITLFRVTMRIAPPDFACVVRRVWSTGEREARKENISLGKLKEKLRVTDG
jgi:hypothetical protein